MGVEPVQIHLMSAIMACRGRVADRATECASTPRVVSPGRERSFVPNGVGSSKDLGTSRALIRHDDRQRLWPRRRFENGAHLSLAAHR